MRKLNNIIKLFLVVVASTLVGCVKSEEGNNKSLAQELKYHLGIPKTNTNYLRMINDSVYTDTTIAWYGDGSEMKGVTISNPFEYEVKIYGYSWETGSTKSSPILREENIKLFLGEEEIKNKNIYRVVSDEKTKLTTIYIRPSAKMETGEVRNVIYNRWKDTIKMQDYRLKIEIENKSVEINIVVRQNVPPKAILSIGVGDCDEWSSGWASGYHLEKRHVLKAIPYYGRTDSVFIFVFFPYGNNNWKHQDKDNRFGDEVDLYIEDAKTGNMIYLNPYLIKVNTLPRDVNDGYMIGLGEYYVINSKLSENKNATILEDRYPDIAKKYFDFIYDKGWSNSSVNNTMDDSRIFHVIAKDKYGGISDFWFTSHSTNVVGAANQTIYNGKVLENLFPIYSVSLDYLKTYDRIKKTNQWYMENFIKTRLGGKAQNSDSFWKLFSIRDGDTFREIGKRRNGDTYSESQVENYRKIINKNIEL